MGLSFRKSITILPGVKVNVSKSGLSLSAGIGGLHGSINTKGQVRGTASLPGTGVRYTKTKNIKDLLPGAEEKKKAEAAEKKAKAAEAKKAKAEAEKAKEEAPKKPKKGDVSKAITGIYAMSDRAIEWIAIKNSSSDLGYENWDYLKERADKVLGGDIDTYLEIINDVNPFAELIDMGCEFECGTDNPMKMFVECKINGDKVLEEYKSEKEIYEDYVAGVALKAGRDIFALLPLWQVEVTCLEEEQTVLNVKFTRDNFESLNFEKIDASDTIKKLGGIIAV